MRIFEIAEKLARNKIVQKITDTKFVTKIMENVQNTELSLSVVLEKLEGTLVLNIPTPPSELVWFGFSPMTTFQIKATPTYGDDSDFYGRKMLVGKVESALNDLLRKSYIIPNMECITINFDAMKRAKAEKESQERAQAAQEQGGG